MALRNDGVENVDALALIEHHGPNAIGSGPIETRDQGYEFFAGERDSAAETGPRYGPLACGWITSPNLPLSG